MGRDQITPIGKDGVSTSKLQRGDLNHRLTNRGTSHVLGDPRSSTGFSPTSTFRRPGLITDQALALLITNLNACAGIKTQLDSGLIKGLRTNTHPYLIEKSIAGKTQRILITDGAKSGTIVIRKTMGTISNTSRGPKTHICWKLTALHARHTCNRLPGTTRVISIHGPTK